jgi:hypothetical protein
MSYIMFAVLLWVCIHTGQAEKFAWPRWESNPRPLGSWAREFHSHLPFDMDEERQKSIVYPS